MAKSSDLILEIYYVIVNAMTVVMTHQKDHRKHGVFFSFFKEPFFWGGGLYSRVSTCILVLVSNLCILEVYMILAIETWSVPIAGNMFLLTISSFK